MTTQNDTYVQFGCGFSAPEGWRNFDASPTLRLERIPVLGRLYKKNKNRFPINVEYADVVSGLPIESGKCKGVYASHVLEHLSYQDFSVALVEVYRILQVGGIFRLVVPDLYQLAHDYILSHDLGKTDACHAFMRDSGLGHESRSRQLSNIGRLYFGNSLHLWMWDELSLTDALRRHGYSDVRRAQLGDCSDSAFKAVEENSRFVGACAIEGRRPR